MWHKLCEDTHNTDQERQDCENACCWCDQPATHLIAALGIVDPACAAHAAEWGTALVGATVSVKL